MKDLWLLFDMQARARQLDRRIKVTLGSRVVFELFRLPRTTKAVRRNGEGRPLGSTSEKVAKKSQRRMNRATGLVELEQLFCRGNGIAIGHRQECKRIRICHGAQAEEPFAVFRQLPVH